MKKLFMALVFGLVCTGYSLENDHIQQLSDKSFTGYLINETSFAESTKTYTYDLGEYGIEKVSAVMEYTTVTLNTATYTNGSKSSGTITVLSTSSLYNMYVTVNETVFQLGNEYPGRTKVTLSPTSSVATSMTVSTVAANLCHAITIDPVLINLTTCTTTLGVINIVSVGADDTDYNLDSSVAAKIRVDGDMDGGVDATVSAATDKITVASHGYSNGTAVALDIAAAPSGLTAGSTYYVQKVDDNTIRLSSTAAQAVAGLLYVDITAATAGAFGAGTTYKLVPQAIVGSSGFYWQYSNDLTNFTNIPSISSVTITYNPLWGDTRTWDFSDFNYRYLTLKANGPTWGGVLIKGVLYLKR